MSKSNQHTNSFYSVSPEDLPVKKVHHYLLSTIAPRPIGFVSSQNEKGEINLSPFSFFNVFGANPPLLIFSPARRVRDNTTKHTLANVKVHAEVVVNLVDYAMVEQMSLSSTEYDKGVNEFIKSGLTQVKSDKISVPRVGESPASFECKVRQVIETGHEGGAGNLVLCEVIRIHVRKDLLNDDQLVDILKLDLVGRMGGSYYTRANTASFFEIPKPIRTKGIGVDSLPASARNSQVLTGNNLGRLGNAAKIPSSEEIDLAQSKFLESSVGMEEKKDKLIFIHNRVQGLLEKDKIDEALAWVWLAERF